MASPKLLEMLNKAITLELQVSIQYMWQHVQWSGVKGFAVHDEFKNIAMVEMKHAERIAERLYYLGGTPSTKPAPITVGEDLKEMIEQDIKAEETGINLYKQIIEVAEKEGDVTTAHIVRDIVEQEEGHHDTFTTLNEKV